MLPRLSDAVNKRLLIKVPLETGFILLLHLSAAVGSFLSQEVTWIWKHPMS